MKKLLKRMLTLVSVAFMVQAIFAQTPSSNTKIVTQDLIEDDIVDNLDTGADGQKSLFFGGFDYSNGLLQAGYGQGFGDALWFSLYDGYYLKGYTTNTDSETSDSVALDGVNTDYTDISSSATVNGHNYLVNQLAFSMYINKKIGGTFFWNTKTYFDNYYSATDPTGDLSNQTAYSGIITTTTTSSSTESTTAGTTTNTKYNTLDNKYAVNTFGLDFNGVSTPNLFGDLNFYVALNKISLTTNHRYINVGYDKTSTLNGVKTLGTASYTGTYNLNYITPALEFETGITGKKLWDVVTPSFVLTEAFQMTFRKYENSYNYNRITNTTSNTETTTNASYELTPGKYRNWNNTLTPRADFSFDLGERITLKARAQAQVSFGDIYTAADNTTTTSTTTTVDNTTGDTNISKTVKTAGTARNSDVFTTEVTPTFKFGLVYQVVPDKFNVNIGVGASSGVLTWTKTTTTNSNIPTITTTSSTNEAGEETVTSSTYTATNGDGTSSGDATAETKKTAFSSTVPSVDAAIGFTLFLGEHAQLDTILLTCSTSNTTTTPIWRLNVNLGLRF